jgi:signal transduction histidine kinase
VERIIQEQHLEAVENRQALQRLSASLVHAQEEERRAIARELHDEIGQALTAVKLNLATVERGGREEAPPLDLIKEARALADRTLHSVRDLSQMLHPAMLDQLGLPETLKWFLRGFSRRTGIRTELSQDGWRGRLAPEIEVSAYRIIQEALTNVAKHAQATRCIVSLRRLPRAVEATVEDDGRGFDAGLRESRRGMGLIGIQERAAGLGGVLQLESAPGRGTRLTVRFPLAPAVSAAEVSPVEPAEESVSSASAESE